MRELIRYWRGEIDRNWIVVPVLAVFLVTASFNARMGYEMGGGWDEAPASLLYGVVFIGLAALGAYGFAQAGAHHGAMRWALLTIGVVQLAVGLQAGWQSLGLTLAKGAAGMESKAASRQTAETQLARARRERDALGAPRPIAAIEAEEKLECKRTSARYADGVGPACTKLRAELAGARRAATLDDEIPQLTAALRDAPRIKDAAANYEVAIALASGVRSWFAGKPSPVTADGARFGFLVFLVAVLELVGTLGFWIAGVHGYGRHVRADAEWASEAQSKGARRPPGWDRDLWGDHPGPVPGRPVDIGRPLALPPMDYRVPLPGPSPSDPSGVTDAGPSHGPGSGLSHSTSGGTGGVMHGSPIHISVVAPGGSPPTTSPGGVGAAPSTLTAEPRPPKPRQPRPEINVADDAPPVDRARMRGLIDQLLAFKAHAILDAPGALVAADDVFRRYQLWAGERAASRALFEQLFAEVAGLPSEEVAGVVMFRNAALKAAKLAVVA